MIIYFNKLFTDRCISKFCVYKSCMVAKHGPCLKKELLGCSLYMYDMFTYY